MTDTGDITREREALFVACPRCQAPPGYHCANEVATIVWPPHLSRMDAYQHRLHPSEDWPQQISAPTADLQHVRSQPPTASLLWKALFERGLVTQQVPPPPPIYEE